MQTALLEPTQMSILPTNMTKVEAKDSDSKTIEVAKEDSSIKNDDKPSEKAHPVIALKIGKNSASTAQQALDRIHQKKGGFKKAEKTVSVASAEPVPAVETNVEKQENADKPIQISKDIVAQHLSPLFYANMINNVAGYIVPENQAIVPTEDTNRLVYSAKPNSSLSFSGHSVKRINANKFSYIPEPVEPKYVFEPSAAPSSFSGHSVKRINANKFAYIPEPVEPKYVFEPSAVPTSFSGHSVKRINANKFAYIPEPVEPKYVFEPSAVPTSFSGKVGKKHSSQPVIYQDTTPAKYVFAAKPNRKYSFSGNVQKTSALYIQ